MWKWVVSSLLLFTVPATAFYPQGSLPTNNPQDPEAPYKLPSIGELSYDDILQLLDDIESGKLEKRCTEEELDKICHLLADLARQGILPNDTEDEAILENDIQELLNGEDDSLTYSFSFDEEGDYTIISAVSHGQERIILCGWASKQWKQAKKFVKKHKTALIIGTVVIVATIVTVGAMAAASAAAAAAGAAAEAEANKGAKDPTKSQNEQALALPPVLSTEPSSTDEAPILTTILKEHISTFKEMVVEDNLLSTQNYPKSHQDVFVEENVRGLGSDFAHGALNIVSKLTPLILELREEIKDIGNRITPEGLLPFSDGDEAVSMERYEKLIAVGHQKIDEVFSTNLAGLYTPEAQKRNDKFVVGELPFPGMFGKILIDANKLAKAGQKFDRAGFTKAGRSLMKHGYRENSVFPKPLGNAAQVNEHGQQILESILNHPEKQVVHAELKRFGKVIDIYSPNIGGVRYSIDGEFIGFLEP